MSPDPPGGSDPTCPQSCVNTCNALNAIAWTNYLNSPRAKQDCIDYAVALKENAEACEACINGCP